MRRVVFGRRRLLASRGHVHLEHIVRAVEWLECALLILILIVVVIVVVVVVVLADIVHIGIGRSEELATTSDVEKVDNASPHARLLEEVRRIAVVELELEDHEAGEVVLDASLGLAHLALVAEKVQVLEVGVEVDAHLGIDAPQLAQVATRAEQLDAVRVLQLERVRLGHRAILRHDLVCRVASGCHCGGRWRLSGTLQLLSGAGDLGGRSVVDAHHEVWLECRLRSLLLLLLLLLHLLSIVGGGGGSERLDDELGRRWRPIAEYDDGSSLLGGGTRRLGRGRVGGRIGGGRRLRQFAARNAGDQLAAAAYCRCGRMLAARRAGCRVDGRGRRRRWRSACRCCFFFLIRIRICRAGRFCAAAGGSGIGIGGG